MNHVPHNARAVKPLTVRAAPDSADNPDTVRQWRGLAYDLERHNAHKPVRRLSENDPEGAFLAAHLGAGRKPFGKKGV